MSVFFNCIGKYNYPINTIKTRVIPCPLRANPWLN